MCLGEGDVLREEEGRGRVGVFCDGGGEKVSKVGEKKEMHWGRKR